MASITITKFKEALEGSYGNVSEIARRCGCSRQTVYNFLKKRPELKKSLERASDEIVDRAEWWLAQYLNPVNADKKPKTDDDGVLVKPPFDVIKYVLSTRGKRRGWTSRVEVAEAGVPIMELPDDVREYLAKVGADEEEVMSEAVNQFVAMMREAIEESNHE